MQAENAVSSAGDVSNQPSGARPPSETAYGGYMGYGVPAYGQYAERPILPPTATTLLGIMDGPRTRRMAGRP